MSDKKLQYRFFRNKRGLRGIVDATPYASLPGRNMEINVTCACGATTIVKDEFAGGSVRCRACGTSLTADEPPPTSPASLSALRLNFIFCDAETGSVRGESSRSYTILDRYALDMSRDGEKRIDRRLALAMGVMLDSGERR